MPFAPLVDVDMGTDCNCEKFPNTGLILKNNNIFDESSSNGMFYTFTPDTIFI
jgi:hypothetical protein